MKQGRAPSWRQDLQDQDEVFAALANASRRHILQVVHFRGGSLTAGEVADRFSCSWPSTSRHLRVLVDAGLLRVEKRGRERIYRVDRKRLRDVTGSWLGWFRGPAPYGPRRS